MASNKNRVVDNGPLSEATSQCTMLAFVFLLGLPAFLFGTLYGRIFRATNAAGIDGLYQKEELRRPSEETGSEETKIAEGEYAIYEQANGGAVGPFGEEIYNFHELWTLWRAEKAQYRIEGVRHFESPKDQLHSNRFVVELSRDFTVVRMTEFAKLRWVRNSGPMSCEFLPAELHCSSGGPDPKRAIELRTHLEEPYGLLWPISPFSLSGITREVERDSARPAPVDLVTIEQPNSSNPVETTILSGPLRYVGDEKIEAAGRECTQIFDQSRPPPRISAVDIIERLAAGHHRRT